jgi:hypothetical protein
MDFPNDYDTRMFPDARYLALARAFAVWSAVLFLVVMALAGMLVWTMRANRADPVLISISKNGASWTAISDNKTGRLEYPAFRAIQEAAIGNFAKMWFRISGDQEENEANWCRCDRAKCFGDAAPRCSVCCAAGDTLFASFSEIVNGDYRARAAGGEEWRLDDDSIRAVPVGSESEAGGLWRLTASLETGGGRGRKIEAFVRTAKAGEGYPATLGYYITDFNAYPGE